MTILLELFFEVKLWYVYHSIEDWILYIQKNFHEFWTILSKTVAKKPTKNRYFEYYLIFTKIRFLPIFFERIVLKSWNLQGKYKIWFSIQWYITLGIKKKIFFFHSKLTFSVFDLWFSIKLSFREIFFCF